MTIRILSPAVANQIAAGEVVERPASVVKELLENAVDANASVIELFIEHGGTRLIQLRDNGSGISKADLSLVAHPHATSKISQLEDLCRIDSLGFRGEALASIASVSRLEVFSRTHDADQAWKMSAEFSGAAAEIVPGAREPGTTVSVRDLFFAHPARRKFLRSENTEFAHIEAVLKRVALSIPHTRLRLSHNGRQIWDLMPSLSFVEQQRRVAKVLGGEFLDHAKYFSIKADKMSLAGWLSTREQGWPNSQRQHFFLNGRWIRDRAVLHGVRQAMASVLTPDTQPAYLLYLELPPTKFDINVHPTKQEVRFSEPRAVHDFICSAITHGALTGLQPEVAQIRLTQQQPESSVANVSGIEPKLKNSLWPQPSGSKVSTNQVRQQLRTYQLMTEQGVQNILGDAVAQLFGQYLITRAQDSWYLIHIARARVALARQALQQQKIDSQPLLVPETLSAPRHNQDSMQSLAKFLQPYGFSIGQIGESQWLIRRIPLVLRYFDSSRLKTMLIEFAGAETELTLDALICALGPAQVASTNLSTEEKIQLVSACGAYLQSLPTHPLPDFVLPIGADWLETQFADPA